MLLITIATRWVMQYHIISFCLSRSLSSKEFYNHLIYETMNWYKSFQFPSSIRLFSRACRQCFHEFNNFYMCIVSMTKCRNQIVHARAINQKVVHSWYTCFLWSMKTRTKERTRARLHLSAIIEQSWCSGYNTTQNRQGKGNIHQNNHHNFEERSTSCKARIWRGLTQS